MRQVHTSCAVCSGPIPTAKQKKGAKYCSTECDKKNAHAKYRSLNPKTTRGHLPSGTVGAMSELRVAVDLMDKQYEVFRSISPACSCDLAILKGNKLIRVEVTTGTKAYTPGNITHPPKDASRYDVLAVVIGDSIVYKPDDWEEFYELV